jgi:hypothetical protein
VKLSLPQREVLERMAHGAVLFVRLEPTEAGVQQTCWIGSVELPPMTVNALITARLLEQRDKISQKSGSLTRSYVMSYAGQAALQAS